MIFRCGGWDEVVVLETVLAAFRAVTKRPRGLCGVAAHRRDAEPFSYFEGHRNSSAAPGGGQ